MMVNCYQCDTEIDLGKEGLIYRRDLCPKCHVDLRCCKMCAYYDPLAQYECKQDLEERIVDKEKSNFCEFFTPRKDPKTLEEEKKKLFDEALKLFKDE